MKEQATKGFIPVEATIYDLRNVGSIKGECLFTRSANRRGMVLQNADIFRIIFKDIY